MQNKSHQKFISEQISYIHERANFLEKTFIVVPQRLRNETVSLLAQKGVLNVTVSTKKHFFLKLLESINPFYSQIIETDELELRAYEWLISNSSKYKLTQDKKFLLDLAIKLVKQVEECELLLFNVQNVNSDSLYLQDKLNLFKDFSQFISTFRTYSNVIKKLLDVDFKNIKVIMALEEPLLPLEQKIFLKLQDVTINQHSSFDITSSNQNIEVIESSYDSIEIEYVFAKIMQLVESGVEPIKIQIIATNDSIYHKVIQHALKFKIPLTYSYTKQRNINLEFLEIKGSDNLEGFLDQLAKIEDLDNTVLDAISYLGKFKKIFSKAIDEVVFRQLLEYAALTSKIEISQDHGIQLVQLQQDTFKDFTFVIGCDDQSFFKPVSADDFFTNLDRKHINLDSPVFIYNQLCDHYLYDLFSNDYSLLSLTYSCVSLTGKARCISPILNGFKSKQITHHLLTEYEETSSQLTTKRHVSKLLDLNLKSSITSIESYYSCPYKYFLRYILKIPTQFKNVIDRAYIGSLFHNEIAVKFINSRLNKVPSYDEINEVIIKYFESHKTSESEIFKKAMANVLTKHFLNIIKIQLHHLVISDYDVVDCEKNFEIDLNSINCNTKNNVKFVGSIDRVDQSSDHIRIVDYKASSRNIDLEMIGLGLSLQLPIYAVIASKIYNKPISFFGYATFKAAFETLNYVDEFKIEKWQKNYQFSPLLLNQESVLLQHDPTLISIPGNRTSNTIPVYGKSKTTGTYKSKSLMSQEQFDFIFEHVLSKVDDAIVSINQGIFNLEPYQGACDFCDYRAVCGFDSTINVYKNPKNQINPLQDLTKGGQDDAQDFR